MQPIMPSEDDAGFFGDEDPRVAYNRMWFNIMRVHRKFYPRITKALKAEGINDPVWYEILLDIERGGPEGRLMGTLEERLFVPQYALSRHISRMEAAGLLRREYIADGRRKQILFLTRKGAGLHQRIWPVYDQLIKDELEHFMSTDEAYAIARNLIRLLP